MMMNLVIVNNNIFERAVMANRELDFKEIHDTYAPKIKLYLAKLAGDDEAEDLAQETFSKVSRSLNNFRGQSSLSTWIYKIATNIAIDRIRKTSPLKMILLSMLWMKWKTKISGQEKAVHLTITSSARK